MTAAAQHPNQPQPDTPERRAWNLANMILDTIYGRTAVLALTLHVTGCAHNAAAPTTPRISIAGGPGLTTCAPPSKPHPAKPWP